MKFQGLLYIFLIIVFIIFILKIFKLFKSNEHFLDWEYNCGECFYKKNKDICEKSFMGKFCNTPCKWTKTIKHNPDGIQGFREFCEENKQFYEIKKLII